MAKAHPSEERKQCHEYWEVRLDSLTNTHGKISKSKTLSIGCTGKKSRGVSPGECNQAVKDRRSFDANRVARKASPQATHHTNESELSTLMEIPLGALRPELFGAC